MAGCHFFWICQIVDSKNHQHNSPHMTFMCHPINWGQNILCVWSMMQKDLNFLQRQFNSVGMSLSKITNFPPSPSQPASQILTWCCETRRLGRKLWSIAAAAGERARQKVSSGDLKKSRQEIWSEFSAQREVKGGPLKSRHESWGDRCDNQDLSKTKRREVEKMSGLWLSWIGGEGVGNPASLWRERKWRGDKRWSHRSFDTLITKSMWRDLRKN